MIKSKLRRVTIILGVVASVLAGLLSIEVASALTAAAAPPPAPPMSLASLQNALAAQQQRGDELEAQLGEMNTLTASLSDALAGTKTYISTQGKTAKDVEKELKAAQAKLAKLQGLLITAQTRLDGLRAAANSVPRGGGTASAPKVTPKPATNGGGSTTPVSGGGGGSTTSLSLTLSISGGGVRADWSACSVSGFSGYALVRSTDSEIHYPPEDHDTVVARTSGSTTAATDTGARSGRMTYRVYCLVTRSNETKSAGSSAAKQIQVP